jgi:hypothetical protein
LTLFTARLPSGASVGSCNVSSETDRETCGRDGSEKYCIKIKFISKYLKWRCSHRKQIINLKRFYFEKEFSIKTVNTLQLGYSSCIKQTKNYYFFYG